MRFSANLGFLFTDRPLPDAITHAKRCGFDAAELHWPYDTPAGSVREALGDMPLLALNTTRGDLARGEFGLSALPGREHDARAAIDDAIAYAAEAGARNIHVMAGKAGGDQAFAAFIGNLRYAAERAAPHGIGLLIEPINPFDVPGYFLDSLALARTVIEAVGSPVLRVMFDCYHLQRIGGNLLQAARENLDIIGHVQIASVPDRAEPDDGEVDYAWLLPRLEVEGYGGYFGAEYRPKRDDLAWLKHFRDL